MFKKLLQFEFFYQGKQYALLILTIAFFAYGYLMASMGQGPANINCNAPYQISYYTSLMTLGGIFIVMFFSISATIRDKQNAFESIIYSTPIQKSHYFFSRFLGVFLFGIIAFTPFFIGYFIGVHSSGLDPERIADFQLSSYFIPWIVFVVPNIFICSVLLFSISLLSKNNIATYVGGIALYVFYMLSSLALNSPLMSASSPPTPEGMSMAAMFDPFGIAAFFEQTQFWVPSERNSLNLSFSGNLLWNRALWIVLAGSILAGVYKIFSFRQINQKIKKDENSKIENTTVSRYLPVEVEINSISKRIAFFAMVKSNIMSSMKNILFMAIMLIWIMLIATDIYTGTIESGTYNDSSYATTSFLVELIAKQLSTFAIMLIVFFSGELVWRSRLHKFNEILDATPIGNTSLFLANLLSLLILPFLLLISSIFIAILFQLMTGYTDFEFSLYASMFYYQGIPLYIYCILAIFIQSIVPNKYLGMAITGAIIFLFGFNSQLIGIHHPMLRFGLIPSPSYSNMNGFTVGTTAFAHFSFYWLSLCVVLAIISFKLLQRGNISTWKEKLKQLSRHWTLPQTITLGAAVLLLCTSATTVYYNTNIVNSYQSNTDQLDAMEKYERKYSHYEDLDRLFPVSINNEVDLFPATNSYTILAKLLMKNKTDHAISTVLIHQRVDLDHIALEGGTLIERDTVYGTYLFEFKTPIAPNQTTAMTFTAKHRVKGYENEKAIINNGTYITYKDFMPRMGYYSGMEIKDKMERQKRGLKALHEEIVTDEHIHNYGSNIGTVQFESIVSTSMGQTALTTGTLINEWETNDRKYFHYKEDQPILPTIAYFSANYATLKDQYENIAITQYYHPEHNQNIAKIAESTKATLAYCSEHFAPYPFDELRIAEIPSHWPFGGFAHPGLISMVEDKLYLVDLSNNPKFDLVAKRTIHEVSHQWWGHLLIPKMVEGGSLFVEGFAKYTEAVMLEKMYGKGALWQLSETANYRYFHGHTYSSIPEPPVYLEDGQNYIAYGKYLTLMLALKDLLGEEKVNSVLRKLLNDYGETAKTRVTALDFLEELYTIAPEHKKLIDDWFKQVITYDLSITDQSYTKLENGRYEVKATVKASRTLFLANGEIEEIGIDEPIRFAVLTKDANEVTSDKDLLHYQLHPINKEITELTFIVDQEPQFVAIDPYGTRVDENLHDNIAGFN
jgi:ABC-2 type transport system permease protein